MQQTLGAASCGLKTAQFRLGMETAMLPTAVDTLSQTRSTP
jgi:hypothetical protein